MIATKSSLSRQMAENRHGFSDLSNKNENHQLARLYFPVRHGDNKQ